MPPVPGDLSVRISTWNVNGLRATVRNDFEAWLRRARNDVVCLQEVKVHEDLLTTNWFEGHVAYWNTAERGGYSGVATLVREGGLPVRGVTRGIGHKSDVEGRVLTVDFDAFSLVNVYAPHSHRLLTRLPEKISFLEALDAFITEKRSCGRPLILVGDFNVAHTEIDLANPRPNRGNAGFLPVERAWIDRLLANGFIDAFRHFEPEGGHYTWWSMRPTVRERNVGWRLDYVFVDQGLKEDLVACRHLPGRTGSDHCPVVVELTVPEHRVSALSPMQQAPAYAAATTGTSSTLVV